MTSTGQKGFVGMNHRQIGPLANRLQKLSTVVKSALAPRKKNTKFGEIGRRKVMYSEQIKFINYASEQKS